MVRFNLQEVFLIHYFTETHWFRTQDKRNYLEIVFIEKGTGTHTINGADLPYKKKDIFLIAQGDDCHFEAEEASTFCVFQFTDLLFSSRMELPGPSHWLRRIEFILRQPHLKYCPAIENDLERQLIWQIYELIKEEYEGKKEYHIDIITNMVSTSLNIIARNIPGQHVPQADAEQGKDAQIEEILGYIHKYAYEPSKMKISALAGKFNTTNSALSGYFKKMTGKSIHNYILHYKLDLVKYRLEHSEFTVSQIAHQLGFTDESHLTRIFKKYFDTTPRQFREEL